jgi:hypothetical protein
MRPGIQGNALKPPNALITRLLLFSLPAGSASNFVIPDRSFTGSGIQGNTLKSPNALITQLNRTISTIGQYIEE